MTIVVALFLCHFSVKIVYDLSIIFFEIFAMPLLNWVNRNQAEQTAESVPYHLLKFEQAYGDEANARDNLIIQGDNLQALKALLPLYGGQVKCIFIDPPYNTQSAFEHYDDKLEHAQWLSMMYPRLQLLKDLLAEDGSIWITLDDNESHYLKVLCDEIFGRRNFLANIVWQKTLTRRNDAKAFSSAHDHVLVYAKSADSFVINKLEAGEKQRATYQNRDNDPRGDWLPIPFHAPNIRPNLTYEIVTPSGRVLLPPKGRCWSTTKEKFEELVADNRIYFGKDGNGMAQRKKFWNESENTIVPWTWWGYEDAGDNREANKEAKMLNDLADIDIKFATPKPEKLISQVLKIGTNENDIVLDSFLGSGTTCAVAHKMNRRYIGIEMGEHAKTHVIPRLEQVIAGEQGGISKAVEWNGGGGFSFYTLGSPVFDQNGFLNADVKFTDLASYIWWLDTKTAYPTNQAPTTPLLGVHDGVAYYLLYNGILGDRRPNGGNVLTMPVLRYLEETFPHPLGQNGKRLIFGEASRINQNRLESLNIEFKQIPYALYGTKTK